MSGTLYVISGILSTNNMTTKPPTIRNWYSAGFYKHVRKALAKSARRRRTLTTSIEVLRGNASRLKYWSRSNTYPIPYDPYTVFFIFIY